MKNIYPILLFIWCCFSCDSFVFTKESRDTLQKEEWNKLNQHQVEEPPLFPTCKKERRSALDSCFQHTIIQHIRQHLAHKTIIVSKSVQDTLWLPIRIDKKGTITLETFTTPQLIQEQIPDFKQFISNTISTLPPLEPAHIRGISVTTQYKLPIVLHVN